MSHSGGVCISRQQEFFDGADIDIEVKTKVIYESDTEDIINQYIIFCKVFDEQRKLYGMTEQLIRKGKMTLEEISDCVSSLSFDELKRLKPKSCS